ncbi:hypothetical protein ABZ508_14610 [Streptomyces lavendulocolor]|uniref:Uncharacterized protein n=1 Tax=Streptomyces lavendulocolor TaxID=67316 RepID=A0ABV2W4W6_9ACTN
MWFEQVFTYTWPHTTGWPHRPAEQGSSVLSVAYEPPEKDGPRRWLLLAGLPVFSELLAFDDAAHAREFARAVLDLPTAPVRYERELHLSESSTRSMASGPAEEERFATLSVGRDPDDGMRAYFAYQSYVDFPGTPHMTALGLEVICDDVDVERAHTEARALLAALDEDG